MFGSKPAKQPKLRNMTAVKRTESVPPEEEHEHVEVAESEAPTSGVSVHQSVRLLPSFPKHERGHRVQVLSNIWEAMSKQKFLRTTDTLQLADVYIVPKEVIINPNSEKYIDIVVDFIVYGKNIKKHRGQITSSCDDFFKMVFLADNIAQQFSGLDVWAYDDWLNNVIDLCAEATSCVKNVISPPALAHWLMENYLEGKWLWPIREQDSSMLCIAFRKIGYHTYKEISLDGGKKKKFANPFMLKCEASGRGKFDYILEARVIPFEEEEVGEMKGK